MEDEGYVDDSFIEETAWDYIARHGNAATAVLIERAEIAERAGDAIAAQTCRAIAEAAARILTGPT